MSVGAYRSVTVGVRDLDAALRLFRDTIGLKVDHDGEAPPRLLRAWGLPSGVRARIVELSFHDYPVGKLRLVRYDPPATLVVRSDAPGSGDSALDIGPKAIDFYVHKDIHESLAEIEALGYTARSRPVRHVIDEVESEELVFSGPDGVPFLVMVGHRHGPDSMRMTGVVGPYSEVATTSIVAGDLAANRRFYGDALGLVAGTDAETPEKYRDFVNDLTGTPRGTRVHFLVYQQPGEPSGKYLLVHFFEASTRRLTGRSRPGALGVSMFSHDVADLDDTVAKTVAAGGTLVAGPVATEYPGGGVRRIALVRGLNEEMFEFRQAG